MNRVRTVAYAAQSGFRPDYAVPPGETLKETLEALGMTEKDLARRTGLTPKTISQIATGKAPITPETARSLERVLGVPMRLWLNLEAHYRESLARLQDRPTEGELAAAYRFPYSEMAKLGWVPATRSPEERRGNLLSFLGIASFEQFSPVCEGTWRISCVHEPSLEALAAWVRKGELEAASLETASFDAEALRAALPRMRTLTQDPQEAFGRGSALREECAKVGVALVLVPALKGTHVQGCMRWLTPDKPVVQLSDRYKYQDVLWFTFFHELGHLLRHGKRTTFVDTEGREKDEREQEADRFATEALIPQRDYERLLARAPYDTAKLRAFASEIGVDVGIVAGRLMHDGVITFAQFSHLRRKLSEVWDFSVG
jgi:HTH-type transcriptional regulator/antitoxin HigA